MARPEQNLLDRLIAEAQADDYALAPDQSNRGGAGLRATTVLIMLTIGALLAASAWQQRRQQPASDTARAELVAQIEEAEQRGDESADAAAALRSSVSNLQRLATAGLSETLTTELAALEIATGYVALQSTGVTMVLDDATEVPDGVEPDEARVLDIDMQLVVNGLWQAGADAIAVNDIRLTSTTAIRTAGEAILVDYRPLRPPYRIVALGDAPALEAGFTDSPAGEDLVGLETDYGIQWEIRPGEDLTVPASTADLPRRAEVVR